jgi:ferrous iron transport protein A
MRTLRDVSTGETVTVIKLHGEGSLKRRVMDMGITKGTSVYVRKVAPLGDPIEVRVRNYELSIRKADAGMVEVSPSEDAEDFAAEADLPLSPSEDPTGV